MALVWLCPAAQWAHPLIEDEDEATLRTDRNLTGSDLVGCLRRNGFKSLESETYDL